MSNSAFNQNPNVVDATTGTNLTGYLKGNGATVSAQTTPIPRADLPTLTTYQDMGNLFTVEQNITRSDSGTTTTLTALDLVHESSGTPAAGFGVALVGKLNDTTTPDVVAGDIRFYWQTPAHVTSRGGMQLRVVSGGVVFSPAIDMFDTSGGTAVGFMGATPVIQQAGDVGTAIAKFGLMVGTPTYAATSLTLLRGYIDGLVTAWASTTSFTVASGMATDSTNIFMMSLGSTFTKTTSAWASGTGNGGLDTSTIANNTWYHVYVISFGASPFTSDVIFSLSASGPAMPGSFTLFRRIGSVRTDSSGHFIPYFQFDDKFLWDVPVQDSALVNVGTAAVVVTLTVPSNVKVIPLVNVTWRPSQAFFTNLFFSAINQTDNVATGTNATFGADGRTAVNLTYSAPLPTMWTSTNAQIRYRLDNSASQTFVNANTVGWIDPRGKNS